MAAQLFAALGFEHYVQLELNSLGDIESRQNYRAALVEYFSAHANKLSEDSLKRLEKNPLRILDSKSEQDKELIAGAPAMHDHFTDDAKRFFADLQAGLESIGIAYQLNDRLVRGLDYYSHTVFEFTTSALGSQNAVLAGGRYDGLIATMGGHDTPGIGWASGVERIMALVRDVAKNELTAPVRPLALIPLGEAAERAALPLAARLRRAGFSVDQSYRGNMSKRMKRADKIHAAAALILGEEELAKNCIMLRDFRTGEQTVVALDALESHLQHYKNT